jgi:hypothetical protein
MSCTLFSKSTALLYLFSAYTFFQARINCFWENRICKLDCVAYENMEAIGILLLLFSCPEIICIVYPVSFLNIFLCFLVLWRQSSLLVRIHLLLLLFASITMEKSWQLLQQMEWFTCLVSFFRDIILSSLSSYLLSVLHSVFYLPIILIDSDAHLLILFLRYSYILTTTQFFFLKKKVLGKWSGSA